MTEIATRTWLTVSDAAEHACVSRDTIYTACERGELQHVRIGGRRAIRLRKEWIDAWLEQHAVAACVRDSGSNTPPGRL